MQLRHLRISKSYRFGGGCNWRSTLLSKDDDKRGHMLLGITDPHWMFILLWVACSLGLCGHLHLLFVFFYVTQRPGLHVICKTFILCLPQKLWRRWAITLDKSLYQAGTVADKCPMCINIVFPLWLTLSLSWFNNALSQPSLPIMLFLFHRHCLWSEVKATALIRAATFAGKLVSDQLIGQAKSQTHTSPWFFAFLCHL